ncbi:hypothetical protein [Acinetobacter indicus]|uniref:hypothetical protein n=1 Tax=Acinetobacter indicus TaxID=756892 RepID=UPI0032B523E2
MRKIQVAVVLSFLSMGCFGNTVLLDGYNKEVEPHYKRLKNASMVLHELREKKLNEGAITSQEYKQAFFLNCSSLGYLNKIKTISEKPKYRNLDKAKRLKSMVVKTKEVMGVTEKDCSQEGIYVPLK